MPEEGFPGRRSLPRPHRTSERRELFRGMRGLAPHKRQERYEGSMRPGSPEIRLIARDQESLSAPDGSAVKR